MVHAVSLQRIRRILAYMLYPSYMLYVFVCFVFGVCLVSLQLPPGFPRLVQHLNSLPVRTGVRVVRDTVLRNGAGGIGLTHEYL